MKHLSYAELFLAAHIYTKHAKLIWLADISKRRSFWSDHLSATVNQKVISYGKPGNQRNS